MLAVEPVNSLRRVPSFSAAYKLAISNATASSNENIFSFLFFSFFFTVDTRNYLLSSGNLLITIATELGLYFARNVISLLKHIHSRQQLRIIIYHIFSSRMSILTRF